MKTAILTHDDCLLHDPGEGHPENPGRLKAVLSALESMAKKNPSISFVQAPFGTREQITRVHNPAYYEKVEKIAPESGIVSLDEDTRMSKGSFNAALRGAGAACHAVDLVMDQKCANAFCATRPPGHHALSNSSMGFCIFNNVAIAAAHARQAHGLKRVAIIDFDVHHGNGTQEIFEGKDDGVMFISFQEADIWPYNKTENTRNTDRILNFPVPTKSDTALYYEAFEKKIIPALDSFAPEFIFISAGFDAHRDDPPGDALFNDPPGRQNLLEKDYAWMTTKLTDWASRHCRGRVVSIMEGGYNTAVLASCSCVHVQALAEATESLSGEEENAQKTCNAR